MMLSILRRTGLNAYIAYNKHRVREAVGQHQFGAGAPQGCETVFHTIAAARASRPRCAVAQVDIAATHQSVHATAIVDSVSRIAPWLARFARAWYSRPGTTSGGAGMAQLTGPRHGVGPTRAARL